METRKYCAYNKTRETFLSYSFNVIDAALEPLRVLKLLIEGLPRGASNGIWLTHFKDVPVAQALSPFDLVYLDKDYRVVHGVELTTEGAFAPFKGEPASALVLPPRSLSGSKTAHGDQLLIRFAEEAQTQVERSPALPAFEPVPVQKPPAVETGAGTHFASATFPPPAPDALSKSRLERFLGPRPVEPPLTEPRIQSARSLIELSPAAPRPAPRRPAQPGVSQGPLSSRPRVEPPVPNEPELQQASVAPFPEPAPPTEPAPQPRLAPSTVIPEAAVYRLQPSAPQATPRQQPPIPTAPAVPHPIDRRPALASEPMVYPIEPLVVPEPPAPIPEHPAPTRVHPTFETREEAPIARPPTPESPAASPSPAWISPAPPTISTTPAESSLTTRAAPMPAEPTHQPPALPEPPLVPTVVRPRLPLQPQGPEPLKLRILRWLFPELTIQHKKYPQHDRRRAYRIPVPDLVAYYWTGGAPRPRKIGNLSVTGFYLQTEERWMPGTVIRMTLQLVGSSGENQHDSVTVHSRLVRWGPDGEAFEFVLAGFDRLQRRH